MVYSVAAGVATLSSKTPVVVSSSFLLSETNQVIGIDTRLHPANVMKKMRNLSGLESSDIIT